MTVLAPRSHDPCSQGPYSTARAGFSFTLMERFRPQAQSLRALLIPAWSASVDLAWSSDAPDLDAELLKAACTGDDEAFRRLVERHQGRLLSACERLLGESGEAQDVVQETFFQAYRKGAGFRPTGTVGAWLYRIAVNGCLKRLRRRRVVRFIGLGPAEAGSSDPAPRPDRQAEARERWRTTRRCIDALPPGQRAVVVLARFEGLSLRQVGQVLGISEKAAESRLARALDRLGKEQAAETRA